jgi:hypothetical protein
MLAASECDEQGTKRVSARRVPSRDSISAPTEKLGALVAASPHPGALPEGALRKNSPKTTSSEAKIHTGAGGGLWQTIYHYFKFKREEFLSHFHKRSNVESTFSMIKAKFRDHVRSKTDTAMVNEVLCKILCRNICCLIQEMYELGIEPEFWVEKKE